MPTPSLSFQPANMSTNTKAPKKAPPTPAAIAQRLLRELASAYVRQPGELEVHGEMIGNKVFLTLQGHRDDHRHLVGSQGQHIWALQTIFAAASAKAGVPIEVALLDPCKGEKGDPQRFEENPDWKPGPTMRLMRRVLDAILPDEYALRGVATGALYTIEIRPAVWRESMELTAKALHLLFHASGNQNGHRINVATINPNTGNIAWEPPSRNGSPAIR